MDGFTVLEDLLHRKLDSAVLVSRRATDVGTVLGRVEVTNRQHRPREIAG